MDKSFAVEYKAVINTVSVAFVAYETDVDDTTHVFSKEEIRHHVNKGSSLGFARLLSE